MEAMFEMKDRVTSECDESNWKEGGALYKFRSTSTFGASGDIIHVRSMFASFCSCCKSYVQLCGCWWLCAWRFPYGGRPRIKKWGAERMCDARPLSKLHNMSFFESGREDRVLWMTFSVPPALVCSADKRSARLI
jgi:hypothetical protein